MAMAWPIPDDAPVTNAFFPCSFAILLFSSTTASQDLSASLLRGLQFFHQDHQGRPDDVIALARILDENGAVRLAGAAIAPGVLIMPDKELGSPP
jgi:hypothetical protein